MLSKLKFLLLPQESNNQKAKSIHLTSLLCLFLLIIGFQSLLTIISRLKPGVLGYASNISTDSLLQLTNNERAQAGLKPLTQNQSLAEAAQEKASAMFAFGCWSHNCNGKTPWWFFKNVSYNYTYAGENLARDFGDSEAVVKAWMESPTHRDNILSDKYQEIGFAVVDGVLDGAETTLVVQLFGTQGAPQLAGGVKEAPPQVEGVVQEPETASPQLQILFSEINRVKPVVSSFVLTKAFSVTLISFMILIFTLDSILIYQRRIVRISGKSFIHLSFFIIILISILLSYPGQIL